MNFKISGNFMSYDETNHWQKNLSENIDVIFAILIINKNMSFFTGWWWAHKSKCRSRDLGLQAGCPSWGSFYGFFPKRNKSMIPVKIWMHEAVKIWKHDLEKYIGWLVMVLRPIFRTRDLGLINTSWIEEINNMKLNSFLTIVPNAKILRSPHLPKTVVSGRCRYSK